MYRMKIATRIDLPALKNISRECRASVTELCPITDKLWEMSLESRLIHLMVDGLTPVGFWLGGPDHLREEISVGLIAIRRAYQGKGLGKRLVDDIKRAAIDVGYDYAMLRVPESRCLKDHPDYALPWLQKMQFKANGVVDRNQYHIGKDAYDTYDFTLEAWKKQVWHMYVTEDHAYQIRDTKNDEIATNYDMDKAIEVAERFGKLMGIRVTIVDGPTDNDLQPDGS